MVLRRIASGLRRLVIRETRTPPGPSARPDIPRAAKPVPPARDTALEQLMAEARYHRERFDLYTAKTYGPRATSSKRLRELQRASEGAAARLAAAKAARVQASRDAADVDEPGPEG